MPTGSQLLFPVRIALRRETIRVDGEEVRLSPGMAVAAGPEAVRGWRRPVAGISENVAERLASLDPVGPPPAGRASVGPDEPVGARARAGRGKNKSERRAMAPRKPASSKKPASRRAQSKAGAKKTASRTKGNGGAAPQPGPRKQEAKSSSPVSPKAGEGTGSGATGAQQQATAFTEPAPGGSQKTVAQMLGEVVWLMTQSPAHKTFFLSDLEWLAMTPILLKQFRVFYATDQAGQEARRPGGPTGKQKNQSAARPIGVAFWALVNEEVEKRLAAGNARLRPADWRSGDRLWVVDIVAPFGGHEEMLKDLKSQVFPNRTFKFRAIVDGQPGVREV